MAAPHRHMLDGGEIPRERSQRREGHGHLVEREIQAAALDRQALERDRVGAEIHRPELGRKAGALLNRRENPATHQLGRHERDGERGASRKGTCSKERLAGARAQGGDGPSGTRPHALSKLAAPTVTSPLASPLGAIAGQDIAPDAGPAKVRPAKWPPYANGGRSVVAEPGRAGAPPSRAPRLDSSSTREGQRG